MPLINCEIDLIVTSSVKCVLSSVTANQAITFAIADIKVYIPILVLSTEDNAKLVQQLKLGFKGTANSNKYQSKVTKGQNRYSDYLTDPSF